MTLTLDKEQRPIGISHLLRANSNGPRNSVRPSVRQSPSGWPSDHAGWPQTLLVGPQIPPVGPQILQPALRPSSRPSDPSAGLQTPPVFLYLIT